MKMLPQSFTKLVTCISLLLALGSCSGGSGGGEPTTLPAPAQVPSGSSTVVVTSGKLFPSSPVTIAFSVSNYPIGLPGTPHLRFSIDGGPQHDFYNGAGINSDNGVLLNGVHTHFVHWTSTGSFDLFALAAGVHQVRLALVDASGAELTNAGATTTQDFTVQQPPSGELRLESVLGGLNFPVGLDQSSDGRIFFNERLTGKVRIINPGWQLDPTPFCSVSIQLNGEQGLLGLALDPNFASTHSLYVYYTAPGPVNRVSKLTNSGAGCIENVILDNLPASINHNGGILKFGPDDKLYVIIGDAENPSNAQNRDSLAGKLLRVNSDGTAAPGNPFSSSANAQKVYSYGHRNSFGITFHPSTDQLWESENGPNDNDEVNRIVIGRNYGWDSNQRGGILNDPCCVDPILVFHQPLIAPTGIVGIPANSPVYPPAYRNNLLMATWNGGTIRLVVPNPSDPSLPGSSSVAYPGGQGGLVSIMLASDGYVYVSKGGTGFGDGTIFKVVPH